MGSIYLYTGLSNNISEKIDKDQAYYVTRLMNFRNDYISGQVEEADFMNRLLEVVRNNSNFSEIDRICIALHNPLSHKVQVLGCATTTEENYMEPGYSCYVSPNSSLETIKRGSVRSYGDVEDIVDSYVENGKPVQRSIYLIKKMGLKSGITIPIFNQGVRGYIFLNSKEKKYFNESIKTDAVYLNMLEMACEEYFRSKTNSLHHLSNLESYITKYPAEHIASNLHLIGEEGVRIISHIMSNYIDSKVNISIEDKSSEETLVPWGQITLIISMILKDMNYTNEVDVEIEIVEDDEFMTFSFSGNGFEERIPALSFDHYRALRKFAQVIGLDLVSMRKKFFLKTEIGDISRYKGVSYSVPSES